MPVTSNVPIVNYATSIYIFFVLFTAPSLLDQFLIAIRFLSGYLIKCLLFSVDMDLFVCNCLNHYPGFARTEQNV